MTSLARSSLALRPRCAVIALCLTASTSMAQTLARPQIVFALGNSQSMDGTLSGAIMTGSGMFASDAALKSLVNSSSPMNYTVPSGFVPPLQAANASGIAPYTIKIGNLLHDNGASRLNVAKAGIRSTLERYLESMDFALLTYQTSGVGLFTTWAYHMSAQGGFKFTNTPPAGQRFVNNPCYEPSGAPLSSAVRSNCVAVSSKYGGSAAMFANRYMLIGTTADDPNINDVMYASSLANVWVNYGGITTGNGVKLSAISVPPKTPFTAYKLADYNSGNVSVKYDYALPNVNVGWGSAPTNAGYVPYSTEVMNIKRGFGYGGAQSADTGKLIQAMTQLGDNPSDAQVAKALSQFLPFLKPETNDLRSEEIKAVAGQAATAGLIRNAGAVLRNLSGNCAGQYVILMTDGLPTASLDAKAWPPLGSVSGVGYGVYASFAGLPANERYGIRDAHKSLLPRGTLLNEQTNNQALIDAVSEIAALNQLGIKTYVIGLGAGVDASSNPAAHAALNAMAIAGGTIQQHPANDIPSFQNALDAIASQIFTSAQITAPLAAANVTAGSTVYLTSSNHRLGAIGGHLQAFRTDSSLGAAAGIAVGEPLWDAGAPAKMSASTRKNTIYSSTASTGPAEIRTLAEMGNSSTPAQYDPAAFGWPLASPSACVPNTETILAYTFNPSFNSQGDTSSAGLRLPVAVKGCSYLAGRELNWMLGSFSANNTAQYVAQPGSALLSIVAGYRDFALHNRGRRPLLLLTSNDGILYGVDVASGEMQWGWMPRHFVAELGQYSNLLSKKLFDGGLRVVDAVDTDRSPSYANWASYVVGTAQGGAYHYGLKLSSNTKASDTAGPKPVAQAWGIHVPGGTSPQMQEPVFVTLKGSQYAMFVVNTAQGTVSTSTLYQVNVATGAIQTAQLAFVAHSTLNWDAATGTLWLGDNKGKVWSLYINDLRKAQHEGTVSPAESILYAGYGEVHGAPYVWVATKYQISVFGLAGNASKAITWSSRGGPNPQALGPGSTAQAGIAAFRKGGEISASPVLVNGVLVVPIHVSDDASSCSIGKGYYNLFNLDNGTTPQHVTFNNNPVKHGEIYVGEGAPLTPSIHESARGMVVFPGSNAPATSSDTANGSINFGGNPFSRRLHWRQR